MNSGAKSLPKLLTVLSAPDMSIFLFLDDNFSKCQWIFTKLGMCIDIVEIWFRIPDGLLSACDTSAFLFPDDSFNKI